MKDKDIKCYMLNSPEITNGDEIDFDEDTLLLWQLLYKIKQIYDKVNEKYPKYILFNIYNINNIIVYLYRHDINHHKLYTWVRNRDDIEIELNKISEIIGYNRDIIKFKFILL